LGRHKRPLRRDQTTSRRDKTLLYGHKAKVLYASRRVPAAGFESLAGQPDWSPNLEVVVSKMAGAAFILNSCRWQCGFFSGLERLLA